MVIDKAQSEVNVLLRLILPDSAGGKEGGCPSQAPGFMKMGAYETLLPVAIKEADLLNKEEVQGASQGKDTGRRRPEGITPLRRARTGIFPSFFVYGRETGKPRVLPSVPRRAAP